ncbi:MAG TPA: hypothetical protein VG984_01630 [Candidatus Paceibacterota bacterium]|nr:hypothetical protein [Candidatus Paceibacterota bacterium]
MGETDDKELWDAVTAVVEPYGCTVTGLGPKAVATMGDARKHFTCVFIKFPDGMTMEEIGRISTKVTNQVDVGRVQMDVLYADQTQTP